MTVYPDSSFLVSWLASWDKHHASARAWYIAHARDRWLISPWAEFETINSLRQLCLRPNGPSPNRIEAIRAYFRHLFQAGPLDRRAVDWLAVMAGCHEISFACAARMRARAADTIHVAMLDLILPDVFVSGDSDQLALAQARGFNCEDFR
jgi:predicted nucleic acid-binding protein